LYRAKIIFPAKKTVSRGDFDHLIPDRICKMVRFVDHAFSQANSIAG
jgi:hypothetical protein